MGIEPIRMKRNKKKLKKAKKKIRKTEERQFGAQTDTQTDGLINR